MSAQWTDEEIAAMQRMAIPSIKMVDLLNSQCGARMIGYRPQQTKLERAQAIAAEVRARRGMVVRKGYYIELLKG